jgi:hypothetical protein
MAAYTGRQSTVPRAQLRQKCTYSIHVSLSDLSVMCTGHWHDGGRWEAEIRRFVVLRDVVLLEGVFSSCKTQTENTRRKVVSFLVWNGSNPS